MQTSALLIEFVKYYLFAGALIAMLFLIIGIERVEPSSRGSYAFRPLLIPGICLIWPLLLYRWYVLEKRREADR